MTGLRLGQASLRWDAIYCAVAALLVLALSPILAPDVGLPASAIAGASVAIGSWAALLWFASRKAPLRPLLWLVLSVNAAATIAVGVSATLVSSVVLSIVLVAVALEVAAFAASQAVALRRLS